ncbi:MAG: 50S ribosomal protein L10 [Candidatus Velamenicoccus archaeovorus]
MPNAEKLEKVAVLKDRIQGSEALLLAEFRGLSVHDATELRRSLADTATFSIVKNTLMKRAADQAGMAELEALLEGPTAVAFVISDAVTAAKRLVDAGRRFPALVLKGGVMEGRVLSAEQARSLADLESREVILSRIAGVMKAEMVRAASAFQALQGRFLALLEAYRDKLPAPAEPAAEVSEPASDAPAGADRPSEEAGSEAAEAETSGQEGEE